MKRGYSRPTEDEAGISFSRIIDVRQDAPSLILRRVNVGIGFRAIADEILRSSAIVRVCEPKSKVATDEYLKRCFRDDYRLLWINRYMDKNRTLSAS